EHVALNGQGGGDSLTITSPGGSEISLTPGATADSGTVTQLGFAPNTTLVPLTYTALGDLGASLTIASTFGGADSGLDVYGTNADDQFNVDPTCTVPVGS